MPAIVLENSIETIDDFRKELENNPGWIIVKFGATWCKPCKKVEPFVKSYIQHLPNYVKMFILDIDECLDLYAFMKTKRMVSGIPSMLAWKKGNLDHVPNHLLSSSDVVEVEAFFQKCVSDTKF